MRSLMESHLAIYDISIIDELLRKALNLLREKLTSRTLPDDANKVITFLKIRCDFVKEFEEHFDLMILAWYLMLLYNRHGPIAYIKPKDKALVKRLSQNGSFRKVIDKDRGETYYTIDDDGLYWMISVMTNLILKDYFRVDMSTFQYTLIPSEVPNLISPYLLVCDGQNLIVEYRVTNPDSTTIPHQRTYNSLFDDTFSYMS